MNRGNMSDIFVCLNVHIIHIIIIIITGVTGA